MRPHSPPPRNLGTRLHCVPMATRTDHPGRHPPPAGPRSSPRLRLQGRASVRTARVPTAEPGTPPAARAAGTKAGLGFWATEKMNAGRQGRGEPPSTGSWVSSLASGGHSFPICRTGTLDAAHLSGTVAAGPSPEPRPEPGPARGGRLRSLPRPGASPAARRPRDPTLRKTWRGGLAHLEVTSTGGDCMTATAPGGARAVTGPWAPASPSPRPRSQPAPAPSAARP